METIGVPALAVRGLRRWSSCKWESDAVAVILRGILKKPCEPGRRGDPRPCV